MGWTVGMPSLKLNMKGDKSKHCGDFYSVAAEALQERLGHDPDINPKLSSKNIYIGYKTAAELIAYSNEHCSNLKDANGKSIRSNAVRMCVLVIKPPVVFMNTLSYKKQKRFLDDGIEKFKGIVGADNVKSLAYHFDEQGPHVHIFWEPITKDGRLSAREVHNLKYLSTLNREMPRYFRKCGWDISDCNAYDQASYNLMTEKEKSERRNKNGRSSYTYKAEAQQKLNELNIEIELAKELLKERIYKYANQTVEDIAESDSNVFFNIMYFISECGPKRLMELNKEAKELKREKLLKCALPKDDLDKYIERIRGNIDNQNTISWEERQKMWGLYNEIVNDFWDYRAELNKYYKNLNLETTDKKWYAYKVYYEAIAYLEYSSGIISFLIGMIKVVFTYIGTTFADVKFNELKKAQQKLKENTATFKKFTNAYRNELKVGNVPYKENIDIMVEIVKKFDKEAERFREIKSKEKGGNNYTAEYSSNLINNRNL